MEKQHLAALFSEKRLLQALFYQPELLKEPIISEDLFLSKSTKNLYKALNNLAVNNVPFTQDALYQEYLHTDLNADKDMVLFVTEPQTEKVTYINDIISLLNKEHEKVQITEQLKDVVKSLENSTEVSDFDKEHITDIAARIEKKSENPTEKRVQTFKEWGDDYKTEFSYRRQGKQYYWRNFLFDDIIEDGPVPGEITILSSASGSGKSTVCLNLIASCLDFQIPCMYYSLEMSKTATMDRLLAKLLKVKYKDLKNPNMDDFDNLQKDVNAMLAELNENPYFRISTASTLTLKQLRKDIELFKKEAGINYCIVFIDLLSMVTELTSLSDGMNFAQGIEVGMNELSSVAKDTNSHILGVLQISNKAQEAGVHVSDYQDIKEKLAPNRGQIKNANAFLERARNVVVTFRPRMYAELYLEKELWENELDIIETSIVKINNGEIGLKTEGLFEGPYFNIDPIDESIKREFNDDYEDYDGDE